MEDKRFAVLIDSDNVSAKYITSILNEMTNYGAITYKRIYGDWTSTQTNKWKQELLENSIMPIQQFSNTTGKNATDSTLIIDAMDILYTNNVDGFCIVSSDSDFTRLASRLRESGMEVIGMGEEKTPRSFRAACSVFTNLEILMDSEDDESSIEDSSDNALSENRPDNLSDDRETVRTNGKMNMKSKSNQISREVIEKDVADIIIANANKEKSTGLGEIGSRLVKKYPDFDHRNYGYSLLSKFLEEMPNLALRKKNSTITVTVKENKVNNDAIVGYIRSIVKKNDIKGVDIGKLGQLLRQKYKNFNVKDFGYSKFSKFVQSIDGLDIQENELAVKIVYYRGFI